MAMDSKHEWLSGKTDNKKGENHEIETKEKRLKKKQNESKKIRNSNGQRKQVWRVSSDGSAVDFGLKGPEFEPRWIL